MMYPDHEEKCNRLAKLRAKKQQPAWMRAEIALLEKTIRNEKLDLALAALLSNEDGARSYSGRGMFGKTCVGIVARDLGFMRRVVLELVDTLERDELGFAARRLFGDMKQDAMGLDQIYYWPSLAWAGRDQDGEDL